MVKFLTKNVFWVIQVIAWGLLGLIVLLQGSIFDHPLEHLFIFLTIMLSGILATSLHRWFLKRYIEFGKLTLKKVLVTFGFVILSAVVYGGLFFGLSVLAGYVMAALGLPETTNDGNVSPVLKVFLFILPFFVLFAWTCLYFLIKALINYNKARVKRLKLRDEVRKAQINTLKGHVNPKFMVGTLRNIKELMLTDVKKSRLMLTELSELLRYSLVKNAVDTVELKEELEMVRIFIDLTKMDRPFNLIIDSNLDKSMFNMEIPPMLLLNFVELCTKEISLNNEPQKLLVILENSLLQFEVAGEEKSTSEKAGDLIRKSMEQRLRLLYGENASLSCEYNDGQKKWRMRFPVPNQNEIMAGV